MDKIFCVVSHTHWDREWYMPFEQFRFKLVDLMDNLLQTLEEYPQYIFHLDAQTIVVEDYLEIRPYKKALLEKYIGEGRLLVGPWYVQNDFYLTSGEATIRNLLIGSKMAEDMGKCTWVGYTPDQFGLISQLPQIFNGFNIDSCIFGRGYSIFENTGDGYKHVNKPSEFVWKGEDASQVLAVKLPFWYNNAQRFSEDLTKSIKLLEMIEKSFDGVALTPYLLLMNGVDHLEAQENLLPILEKLNTQLPEGKTIKQISMPEYIKNVKSFAENLSVYKGEMRNGEDYHILQGTLSSRIYLKTANVRAQNLLESRLEPLYAFISMLGAEEKYPADFLHYLWKLLIQNHPHDSICGCSRDEIHAHMEDRFARIQEAGGELLQRGMDFISAHIDRSSISEGDYLINLFSTTQKIRSSVVEVELQFPVEEKVEGFKIVDGKGIEVPFAVLSKEVKHRNIFSPINLPGSIEVDTYKIQFYLPEIEGMSYKTLIVKPGAAKPGYNAVFAREAEVKLSFPVKLENEKLLVSIELDGTVDLTYKETGRKYGDILSIEDSEDCGDSYVYGRSANGGTYTTKGLAPEIGCVLNTRFETVYSLKYNMKLPEGYNDKTRTRSERLVSNSIEIIIGLKKGSSWLNIDFNIDNVSKDHRLRALFSTGISSDFTYANSPFDIVKRDRRDVIKGICNGTQPNSGCIDINDGNEGLTVLNQGIYEYEHLLDDKGIVALTLLRANGKIEVNSKGDTWQVPGNQCLRRIKLGMALYPHAGDAISSEAIQRSIEFLNPVLCNYQPSDTHKFIGGRPAVQDSAIKEIFYRKDPYAHIVLPLDRKLIDVKGMGIVVSSVKKCEQDNRVVVRLYNATEKESEFELDWLKPISSAKKLNLKEEFISKLEFSGNKLGKIKLKPKEIYTLEVE